MSKLLFAAASLIAFVPLVCTSAEWRFFSDAGPNGNTVFLSESPSYTKGCKGKQEASAQMYALGKWTYIRELCYEVDNAGMVKLTDPEKMMFFNTFKMSASGFRRIPTEKERAEAKAQLLHEESMRASSEFVRQTNESIDRQRQERRQPIICDHFGATSICN